MEAGGTMKFTIAMLAAIFVTTGALAQNRGGANYGPFTDAEAQLLSAVWPEIREAENYGDINWPAHGLARAPGSREVQRLMASNWPELRTASRFEQIDWDELLEVRGQQTRRYGEDSVDRFEREFPGDRSGRGAGPFTSAETAVMSQVWPQIREAARYEDINWRALGVERAPGDRTARAIMASNWGQLRGAARFEDINWAATRASSPNRVLR
jgi:hypothetical protein